MKNYIALSPDQQQELKGLLDEAHSVLLQIDSTGENLQCAHLQDIFDSIEELTLGLANTVPANELVPPTAEAKDGPRHCHWPVCKCGKTSPCA